MKINNESLNISSEIATNSNSFHDRFQSCAERLMELKDSNYTCITAIDKMDEIIEEIDITKQEMLHELYSQLPGNFNNIAESKRTEEHIAILNKIDEIVGLYEDLSSKYDNLIEQLGGRN